MKHALIAPTQYLHLIPEQYQSFHLVLAHLLEDKQYAKYYKEQKEKGAFIIVDNGAYEFKRPLEADELLHYVGLGGFEPDIIVAPDYPFENWVKTVKSTEQFAKIYGNYFDSSKTKLMAVPQSVINDYEGWLEAYRELSNMQESVKWIGMSILGIPHAWREFTGTNDISFNRIAATQYILSNGLNNKEMKHHYLGCSNPREILMMSLQGLADSNDSSTVFWHGINGIKFDNSSGGLIDGKTSKEVDFSIEYDPTTVSAINHNLNELKKYLK